MRRRRGICNEWLRILAASAFGLGLAAGASGQSLLPPDYFNAPVTPGGAAGIAADLLTIDSATGTITASGRVVLDYQGYRLTGERLIYDRRSGAARFSGPVTVRDPSGNLLEGRDLAVGGGMREAVIAALAITGYDGTLVTADSAEYDAAARNLLHNMTYAPCGECIDAAGRRIGWSVRASRVVQNADETIEIENPTLEILGVPVAWLPYLWLPDTSEGILSAIEMPRLDYSEALGVTLSTGVRVHSSRFTDIILSPTLMSRQGLLLGAEWVQRVETGGFRVKASGVYQLNPLAFGFSEAQRDWRGAIQTAGAFRPLPDWTAGWSYTAFTDAAFLPDYGLDRRPFLANEIYGTHLSADTYFDLRVQQFRELGDVPAADQDRQAITLPNARLSHILELGEGLGRIELSGRLLGVRRALDHVETAGAVEHVFGFSGEAMHLGLEAGWRNQWIGPGGVVLTPYLGLRADAASYDGASAHPDAPGAATVLSATPIAALDVSWPLVARATGAVHIVEPIAQIAWRGGSDSFAGLVNNDAQSFVFDDTNLFSHNRFSGWDRQETGLRVTLGGRYSASFAGGAYLELIAGQSFQIAGANAFAAPDPAMPGATIPLAGSASHAVLAAYAGTTGTIGAYEANMRVGAKLVIDSASPAVHRAGIEAQIAAGGYTGRLDYFYEAANPLAGTSLDRHEIGGEIGIPLVDYWRLTAGGSWDIAGNTWLQASGGLRYDDGYLEIGAEASVNGPTHVSPHERRATLSLRLKTPSGS